MESKVIHVKSRTPQLMWIELLCVCSSKEEKDRLMSHVDFRLATCQFVRNEQFVVLHKSSDPLIARFCIIYVALCFLKWQYHNSSKSIQKMASCMRGFKTSQDKHWFVYRIKWKHLLIPPTLLIKCHRWVHLLIESLTYNNLTTITFQVQSDESRVRKHKT